MIGGQDIVVEIDEAYFGAAKYNRGRRRAGIWVVGGLERLNKNNCFLFPVRNRSAATLEAIITRWVRPGSIIYTDCWRSYSRLKSLGYQHGTVNHSTNFVNPINKEIYTQNIEAQWKVVKDGCPTHGSRRHFLTSYIYTKLWRQQYECKNPYDTMNYFLQSTLNCNCCLGISLKS